MNKTELEQQIRTVCRMRRLSRHTERFVQHIATCPQLTREEKLRTWLERMAPLDALTQSKIVPFTTHAVQSTALAERGALALNGVA
jgi:hypothetical protein